MKLGRGKIRPENGVVDMTTAVEFQSRLERERCRKVLLRNAFCKLFLSHIQAVHVRLLSKVVFCVRNLVMFLVVNLHDFRRNSWLQCVEVIRKIGEGVLRSEATKCCGS